MVSDLKLWTDNNTNNTPDGGEFTADVLSYANYYAYGMMQPGSFMKDIIIFKNIKEKNNSYEMVL